jgi:hypothetical protein
MRDKVTLTEKCIELGNRATDEEEEPAAPEGGGGFSEAFKLVVNMLRIGAEEAYRSLEALLEHTPAIRDELEIDEDEIPDYSTVCRWYQEIMMEVLRLLLRHSPGDSRHLWPGCNRQHVVRVSSSEFLLYLADRLHL